jgi:predicted nucleotide-binding protein
VTADDLRAFLTQRGARFEEKEIAYATQFRCQSGEVFNMFDSGKLVFGGKVTSPLSRAVRDWHAPSEEEAAPDGAPERTRARGVDNRIFIVYGHDVAARDALELVLRRMEMEPIILGKLPAAGDTIIEKLMSYLGREGQIGFACVLLTPDDEGHAQGAPEAKKYRARQNVILELGMVLARLGRPRVAILYKESVELPSDINGLIYIGFKERVDEVKGELFRGLEAAGYQPSSDGLR